MLSREKEKKSREREPVLRPVEGRGCQERRNKITRKQKKKKGKGKRKKSRGREPVLSAGCERHQKIKKIKKFTRARASPWGRLWRAREAVRNSGKVSALGIRSSKKFSALGISVLCIHSRVRIEKFPLCLRERESAREGERERGGGRRRKMEGMRGKVGGKE